MPAFQDPPPTGESPRRPLSPRVQATRQRILSAAAQEFAARGYAGATTRAIAGVAGVSELTLFRHFETKKNLFVAVIAQQSPISMLQATLGAQMTGEIRHDLHLIGSNFLQAILQRREVILLTLREAEQLPEVRQASQQVPLQQRQMLAGYLKMQMEQGVLRPQDPELAAQAFLGLFFAYAISQSLTAESGEQPRSVEAVTQTFVDIFLNGMMEGR
ncbi:MAG: TetR/AcrR family transcriptional regulator [Chloroflexota bacterium]